MGMMIDKAIPKLQFIRNALNDDMEIAKAYDLAILIMRKYQKIREIAFPLQFCSTDKLNHEAIMKICEVLEDEKTD